MQKNIVDLVEYRLVCFVAFASSLSKVCGNAIPPFFKLAYHAIQNETRSTLTFQFAMRRVLFRCAELGNDPLFI